MSSSTSFFFRFSAESELDGCLRGPFVSELTRHGFREGDHSVHLGALGLVAEGALDEVAMAGLGAVRGGGVVGIRRRRGRRGRWRPLWRWPGCRPYARRAGAAQKGRRRRRGS